MEAARLIIRGRVQGVGYRAFVADEARRLGAVGWVRNRADGTVETLVCGSPAVVEAMIAACRRGPRHAVVENVEVEAADARPGAGFEVLGTL